MTPRILIILIALSLTAACKPAAKPEEVTLMFWQAIQQDDLNSIKRLSNLENNDDYMELKDKIQLTSVQTGKIIIDGEKAEVETTLESANSVSSYTVTSYLYQDNNEWRVDYKSTMSIFMIDQDVQALIKDIEILSEEFTKQIEGSVEDIKEKAVPKIRSKVQELEQELEKKIPEVRDKIYQFLEDLERSIELPPETEQQEPTTTQT